eukprot:gene15517-18429_t
MVTAIEIDQKPTFWPCHAENDNLWWYPAFKKQFLKEIVDEGADPHSSDDWNNSGEFSLCYYGIITVNYTLSGDHTFVSEITGLWSSNDNWVKGYLTAFKVGDEHECYYNKKTVRNVIPFAPHLSDTGLIWGVVFAVTFLVNSVTIVVLSLLRNREKKSAFSRKLINGGDSDTDDSD